MASVTKSDVYMALQRVNQQLKNRKAPNYFSVGRDVAGYNITQMNEGSAERTLLYGVTSKVAFNFLRGAEQALEWVGI